MTRDEAQFAKALFEATIGLFPAAGPAKAFIGPLFDRATASTNIASIEQASKAQAKEIIAYFMAMEETGVINAGSGHAAAADFSAILSRTKITPRLLIELELDADLLWRHLLAVGEPELREASQGRYGCVREGLRNYAEALIQSASDLPSVRLEFMRAMLKPRRG